jgi:purine-binding chemotaxis protein CheW
MPAPPEPPPDADRLIVFRVAGRDFAVPLRPILEVIRHRPPTPVPWADPAVEGILPLRGRMVTVVDARLRLGLGRRPEGGGARVIVVDGGQDGLVGLAVDEVTGVAPAVVPEPAPAALRLAAPALCRGVVPGRERAVLVLDLAALLGGGS